jgi:hypothetical protein
MLVSAAAAALGAGQAAFAAPAAPLKDIVVPHRAVYDISLVRSDEGSGVSSASGRMVFEVTGGPCEGYRMRQRMVVKIGDETGDVDLLDFRIVTFESADGGTYSFDSRTTLDDDVVEAVEGEARRVGSEIEIALERPSRKTVRIDANALFPTQHLQAILEAAQAQRRFVAVEIYEGAGTGEASDEASASIGAPLAAGHGVLQDGIRRWPVTVGYFDQDRPADGELGEETPSYQMQFTLYENGVTNDLLMDYGDYALAGALASIEPLERPACPTP